MFVCGNAIRAPAFCTVQDCLLIRHSLNDLQATRRAVAGSRNVADANRKFQMLYFDSAKTNNYSR
jgi:hypothetical protein